MTRIFLCVVVSLLPLIGWTLADGPKPPAQPTGLFAPLRVGQQVSFKEAEGRYQINVVPGVDLGHKVVEVGADYLVVEDIAGITQIRIPVYSVKSVTVSRFKAGK